MIKYDGFYEAYFIKSLQIDAERFGADHVEQF